MRCVFDPNQLPMPDLGILCHACGYPLAHVSAHRCPECGWKFTADDLVPPGDFPPLYADGKPVRGTVDVLQMLKTYQVPFITQFDHADTVFGLIRTSRHVGDPISVPRNRYLEVVDLLRRKKQGEPMPPPPVYLTDGENWTCPQCREVNPPNFEICWNCEDTVND